MQISRETDLIMALTFMTAGKRVTAGHAPASAAEPARPVTRQAPALAGRPGDLLATVPISAPPARREERGTPQRLPGALRSGLESLSGIGLDAVRVHYNSPAPDRADAGAYAQGADIHISPGHEHLLPHEAWHVVQQAQRRVPPGHGRDAGAADGSPELEREADIMGSRALGAPRRAPGHGPRPPAGGAAAPPAGLPVTQLGRRKNKKFKNKEGEFLGAAESGTGKKKKTTTHVHFYPDGGGHLKVDGVEYAFNDAATDHDNADDPDVTLPAGIAALQGRAMGGNLGNSPKDKVFKDTYRLIRENRRTSHWFTDADGDEFPKPDWYPKK
jgi:Domain of unknown function (DUF4157)